MKVAHVRERDLQISKRAAREFHPKRWGGSCDSFRARSWSISFKSIVQSHAAIAIPESCPDMSSDPFAKRQSCWVLNFFLNEQKRIRSWQVLQISRILILSPSEARKLLVQTHTQARRQSFCPVWKKKKQALERVQNGGWYFLSKEKIKKLIYPSLDRDLHVELQALEEIAKRKDYFSTF